MTTSEYNEMNARLDFIEKTGEDEQFAIMEAYVNAKNNTDGGVLAGEDFADIMYDAIENYVRTQVLATASFEGDSHQTAIAEDAYGARVVQPLIGVKRDQLAQILRPTTDLKISDVAGLGSKIANGLVQNLEESTYAAFEHKSQDFKLGLETGVRNRASAYGMEIPEGSLNRTAHLIEAFQRVRAIEKKQEATRYEMQQLTDFNLSEQ